VSPIGRNEALVDVPDGTEDADEDATELRPASFGGPAV